MTKLNNLTKGKWLMSSVKFDVGKRDETKTAITTNNHIYATSIYTYIAPHKKSA
jgi:hypothetical protein